MAELNDTPFSASAAAQRIRLIRDVKHATATMMLGKANVHSIGVGFKNPGQQGQTELCLVVGVRKKMAIEAISAADLIPKLVEGIKTDVIELPEFRAFAQLERLRPARPGLSIGQVDITAGTLGLVVRKGGRTLILSNNHVLANGNKAPLGSPILQPGPLDGGKPDKDVLAKLAEFVPIVFDGETVPTPKQPDGCGNGLLQLSKTQNRSVAPVNRPGANLVDCALAEPVSAGLLSPDILGIGVPRGVLQGTLGSKVQKSGRTTSYTTGVIEQIDVTSKVDYDGRTATFTGQLLAGGMSDGGDSGSAILDMSGNVVGLLFAGSNTATLINPIQSVIEALGVELVLQA